MSNQKSISENGNDTNQTLMEFPCSFPLKVFGRDRDLLEPAVIEIIQQHIPGVVITEIKVRPGKTGKFIALTLTFDVQNKNQLEKIYLALSEHDAVTMTL